MLERAQLILSVFLLVVVTSTHSYAGESSDLPGDGCVQRMTRLQLMVQGEISVDEAYTEISRELLPYTKRVAKRYAGYAKAQSKHFIDEDSLIQDGNFGLYLVLSKAVDEKLMPPNPEAYLRGAIKRHMSNTVNGRLELRRKERAYSQGEEGLDPLDEAPFVSKSDDKGPELPEELVGRFDPTVLRRTVEILSEVPFEDRTASWLVRKLVELKSGRRTMVPSWAVLPTFEHRRLMEAVSLLDPTDRFVVEGFLNESWSPARLSEHFGKARTWSSNRLTWGLEDVEKMLSGTLGVSVRDALISAYDGKSIRPFVGGARKHLEPRAYGQLVNAIDRLPRKQRIVAKQFYLNGMTVPEIAKIPPARERRTIRRLLIKTNERLREGFPDIAKRPTAFELVTGQLNRKQRVGIAREPEGLLGVGEFHNYQLAAQKLPEDEREVLRLYFEENLLSLGIADRLEISDRVASRLLKRALQRMTNLLRESR